MSEGTIRMLPQGSYVTFQSGSTQPVLNRKREVVALCGDA